MLPVNLCTIKVGLTGSVTGTSDLCVHTKTVRTLDQVFQSVTGELARIVQAVSVTDLHAL